jgi:hypothetical protein
LMKDEGVRAQKTVRLEKWEVMASYGALFPS